MRMFKAKQVGAMERHEHTLLPASPFWSEADVELEYLSHQADSWDVLGGGTVQQIPRMASNLRTYTSGTASNPNASNLQALSENIRGLPKCTIFGSWHPLNPKP